MLGVIFIVVIVIAFYAFIGLAPGEAVQVVLTLVWGILILSIPISFIYALMR